MECNLDEFLITSLGVPRKKIKHHSGKGKVLLALRKNHGKIGIVDEDPDSSQPNDIKEYKEIDQTKNLKLLERKGNEVFLIIISKYLEDWIVNRANINKIELKKYGYENNPKSLHNIPHIENHPKFKEFLNELILVDEEMKTLKNWLNKYKKY